MSTYIRSACGEGDSANTAKSGTEDLTIRHSIEGHHDEETFVAYTSGFLRCRFGNIRIVVNDAVGGIEIFALVDLLLTVAIKTERL